MLLIWFVRSALVAERSYQVAYPDLGPEATLSSDEIIYEELRRIDPKTPVVPGVAGVSLRLINRSGQTGLGAEWRVRLEDRGYSVSYLATELSSPTNRTVIVYDPMKQSEALALSELFSGALLSAFDDPNNSEVITVYIGSDALVE
jgi:hypothetical protein